jgi:GTP-binding protein
VVDVSGSEGRDPIADFDAIQSELAAFSEALADRPMLVAGNKCDLATDEQLAAFEAEMQKRGLPYFPMMAAIAHGTDPLIKACAEALSKLPPVARFEAEEITLPDADSFKDRSVQIRREDDVFFVEAPWLLQVMRGINFDDSESLQYFERVLRSSGVIDALEQAGVEEGNTVSIYDFEFEFVY